MAVTPNAPINTLPNEILAEIFCLVKRLEPECCLITMHLTHVCSRWRHIAVSLPPLWTYIQIDEHTSDSKGHCSLLKLFLERSSNYLLDVIITVPCPKLSRILFQHSARWRTCHLLLTPEHPGPDSPLLVVKDNIPMLEELCFDWDQLTFSEDPLEDSNDTSANPKRVRRTCFLGDMPKLRRLTLMSVDCYISRVGFPWEQLRHLSLISSWSSNIDSALQLCPYLESARFDYIYHHDDDFKGDQLSYTCPNLRSLKINTSYARTCTLPQYGVFPSLEELELGGPGEKGAEDMVKELLCLLRKSSCRLQTLSLAGKGLPSSDLIRLLSAIPSLTSLSLSNYYGSSGTDFTEDLFKSLTWAEGDTGTTMPSLLPVLTRLRLEHRLEAQVNVDLLLHMLQSRQRCESLRKRRLESADLGRVETNRPEHVLAQVQRLRAEGLDIKIAVPG